MATINMPSKKPDALERLAQGLGIATSILNIGKGVSDIASGVSEREKLAKFDDAASQESASAREGYKSLGFQAGDTDSASGLERKYGKLAELNQKQFESRFKADKPTEDKGVLGADKLADFQSKGLLTAPGRKDALTMDFLLPGGKRVQYGVLTAPKEQPGGGLTVAGKLDKQPAEVRSKVGLLANALGNMTQFEAAFSKGQRPSYVDSNTPVVGALVSDTDLTRTGRMIDEAVGRLQSGGVIGKEELDSFRAMRPRPGDNPEQQAQKIADMRTFLEDRLTALGFHPQELGELGFDPVKLGYSDSGAAMRKDLQGIAPGGRGDAVAAPGKTNFDNQDIEALKWARENPKDPRAGEILQKLRSKGLR